MAEPPETLDFDCPEHFDELKEILGTLDVSSREEYFEAREMFAQLPEDPAGEKDGSEPIDGWEDGEGWNGLFPEVDQSKPSRPCRENDSSFKLSGMLTEIGPDNE